MQTARALPENPRERIGGNNPPADGDDDDKSPPTPEEARIVFAAISYVQFKRPGLEDILIKRKAGVKMGWRHLVMNALKDRVRQNSLAKLLKINRKTLGENQKRADAWAEYDEEFGTGEFGRLLADLRAAIVADSHVDVDALDVRVRQFVKLDPDLRKMEEQQRAHELAAREADRAAAEMEAKERTRAKERDRLAKAMAVRKSLKGVPGKEAIVAQHLGAAHLARTLGKEAVAVIERITKADAKGVRRLSSHLDAKGLKDCKRLGLARDAVPHLAPPTDDPPIAPTDLCKRVFVEAVQLGRIKVKKKRQAA